MKRYTTILMLIVMALGGVCIYYVYTSSDKLPAFRLAAVEGDAAEGEQIVLTGNYRGRYHSPSVHVSSRGSDYPNRRVFYRQILAYRDFFGFDPKLADIRRTYKDFFRGKGAYWNVWDDEELLIYADIPSATKEKVRISVLDKKTGRTKELRTALKRLPERKYVYVSDLQRIGGELHVITYSQSSNRASSRTNRYTDWVFTLNDGALIRQTELDFGQPADGAEREIRTVQPGISDKRGITVYQVLDRKPGPKGVVMAGKHTYVYSFRDSKLKELPDTLATAVDNQEATAEIEGNMFYTATRDNGSGIVTLQSQNLETGEAGKKIVLTPPKLGADSFGMLAAHGDRVYVQLQLNQAPLVAAVDASNGSILYKGEVRYLGPEYDRVRRLQELFVPNVNLGQ